MSFEHRRQEQVVVLAYALTVATVVLCARAGLFPGTGQALPAVNHPYRLSMAATGSLLALFLGAASGWIGVRRGSRLAGIAALAAGGFATGVALSFNPVVLYPNDQYPVSFGWVVGGAPLAAATWLVATLVMSRPAASADADAGVPRLLYTWTKSIAAGTYLVPLILIPSGALRAGDPLWHTVAPVAAAAFLALAGGFLIWDMGSPQRVSPTFKRPGRRNWRARAGLVIAAYGTALILPFLTETRPEPAPPGLAMIGGVLAVVVAVLFGPAQAREGWQAHLLPVQLLGQALVGGAGATVLLTLVAGGPDHPAAAAALLFLALATAAYVLVEAARVLTPGPLAGRAPRTVPSSHRAWFWLGVVGAATGVAAPWLGWPAAPVVLGGLLAYQHARGAATKTAGRVAHPSSTSPTA